MAKEYNRDKTKGLDLLQKMIAYYDSLGRVAKRFGVRRETVAALANAYLSESGKNLTDIMPWNSPELMKYMNDGQITDEGWRIVLACIYRMRNTTELLRVRKIERLGQHLH